MKELDPVQFCVLLSFIESSIWRVKNRPLPLGTRSLETKGCRRRVGRGAREELIQSHQERNEMRSALAEGWPWWEGSEACQLVAWALHYLLWRALRATHALSLPAPARSSLSALSTALEVCGLKSAGSRACDCGLGVQSPQPTATMVGKGAKGMLVSTGTRLQVGHEHCPLWSLLPAACRMIGEPRRLHGA